MPNRYCRDELIKVALQMVQLPNLERHDMPNGVVQQDAFCIQWLQDILDFWYHMVPFSATVGSTPLNCTAGSDTVILPSDFILDVRNGYCVQSKPGVVQSLKRIYRVPVQKFITRQLFYQTTQTAPCPIFYSILGEVTNNDTQVQNQLMRVTPSPNIDTVGQLWYYRLPAALASRERPTFPSDYVCIEYLRIRALEWNRSEPPGTAQLFCDKIVGGMKAAGLMNEPEDDEIPFDNLQYNKARYADAVYATSAWMGPQAYTKLYHETPQRIPRWKGRNQSHLAQDESGYTSLVM